MYFLSPCINKYLLKKEDRTERAWAHWAAEMSACLPALLTTCTHLELLVETRASQPGCQLLIRGDGVHPKCLPIYYKVQNFSPGPIVLWSKEVNQIVNRVSFGVQTWGKTVSASKDGWIKTHKIKPGPIMNAGNMFPLYVERMTTLGNVLFIISVSLRALQIQWDTTQQHL